jgi:hypothetical protein
VGHPDGPAPQQDVGGEPQPPRPSRGRKDRYIQDAVIGHAPGSSRTLPCSEPTLPTITPQLPVWFHHAGRDLLDIVAVLHPPDQRDAGRLFDAGSAGQGNCWAGGSDVAVRTGQEPWLGAVVSPDVCQRGA